MSELIPHLIEPEDLVAMLDVDNMVIVDLSHPALYQQRHVPGAVHLAGNTLMANKPPALGKHPDFKDIERLVSNLGIDDSKHVVIYDDEGGGCADYTKIMIRDGDSPGHFCSVESKSYGES